MNETQLIQRIRGLDTPVDPSPGFADELFGSVNRQRQRASGRRFGIERPQMLRMAAASVAILVVLGIASAYLAGPSEPAATPITIATSSPSPLASSEHSASASPTATAAPTAPTTVRSLRPLGTDAEAAPNFRPWTTPWSGEVASVTSWRGGFVAVGNRRGSGTEGLGHENSGVVWTSPEGRTWESIEIPSELATSDLVASYVAADGQLVVLRGDQGFGTSTGWTSADGEIWSPISTPRVFEPTVVGEPGAYVMIDPRNSNGVWTSADGLAWDPFDPTTLGPTLTVVDAAVGGGSRMLVACEPEEDRGSESWHRGCRTWVSTDETTWQQSDEFPRQVRAGWFGGEWVAAALIGDDGNGPGPAGVIQLWRSIDGVEWTPVARITDGFVNGNPERLWAVGDHLILRAGTSYTRTFICNDSFVCQPTGISEIIARGGTELNDVVVLVGSSSVRATGSVWSWDTAAE